MTTLSIHNHPLDGEAYVKTRILPRIAWYDRRAVSSKRLRRFLDAGAAFLAIALVFLIPEEAISRTILAVVPAVIGVLMVVERMSAYGEKWILYRLTAEELEREIQLFRFRSGPYADTGIDPTQLLVERTEMALLHEASRWRILQPTGELTLGQKLGG